MATSADMAATDDGLGDSRTNGAGNARARNGRHDLDQSGQGGGVVALAEAGAGRGMALADSTPSTQKWKPDDSVYLRLARAQDDVKTITQDATIKVKSKDDNKSDFTYKGVSSPQVVTFAKRALLDNGIVFIPVPSQDGVRVAGNKTALWVEGHFISVDDPSDKFASGAWGAGTDNNDKDYAKAMTNAVKIILSKVLMMSTLEDESDEATPHEPNHKPKAVKTAEAVTDVAIRTWGDAYKAAIDGCKTVAQLKKVRGENAHMMNNPNVPQVTKDYFIDKIAALEGTLE